MYRLLLSLGCCWALTGCGLADSQVSFLPDGLKQKPPEAPAQEPMPDVKALVKDRGNELFAGAIEAVLVSQPRQKGTHWEFCVRPVGRGAGGQPLPVQSYLVTFERGRIGDRLPVDSSHWCNQEKFERN